MKLSLSTRLLFVAASILSVPMVGCESSGAGQADATSTGALPEGGTGGSSNTGKPGGGNGGATDPNRVGESCQSDDPDHLCLAIHFVTYKDSKGNVTASAQQAATIIRKMNQVWSACQIGFEIETYEAVTPSDYGLYYGAQSQSETDEIRAKFSQPSNQLLAVTTGPWGTAVNGWTNLPGDNVYGAIMEASIVGYGDGIIYAHEFGHYLGLNHVSSTANLMSPVIYTNSTNLSNSQCDYARDVVRSYWSAMIR